MNKHLKITIFLIIAISSINNYTQGNDNIETKPLDQLLTIGIGGIWHKEMLVTEIEGSYFKNIHRQGFLGGKIGWQTNGFNFNKIHLGPCYSYTFLEKPTTPFFEIDLRLCRIDETYYSPGRSFRKEMDAYTGGYGLIYIGYKLKKTKKRIGYEFKYGIGSSYEKEILHNIETNKIEYGSYKFEFESQFIFGMSYYF